MRFASSGSRLRRIGILHLFVLILSTSISVAQEAATTPQDSAVAGLDGYRIGPGDVLAIEVTRIAAPEQVRVSNSGKIHLPLLGIIRVADMTTAQLTAAIRDLLIERDLVKDPWVTVRVTQYLSQPVYVLGEVALPGQFAIKGDMYLVDLITMAMGFNEEASRVGYLYRRKPDASTLSPEESPTDEAIAIDFQALNEGRNPEHNYKLRGGDVLYVPRAAEEYYFLIGDVKAPSRYKMIQGLLASRALATGGGPLKTAKLSKGVLVRVDQEGKRHEMPLDFEAILRGQKPDVTVQTGDIVYVPGSKSKTLAYAMIAMGPGILLPAVQRIPR